MTQGTVVLFGNLPMEHVDLDLLAAEFGWSVQRVGSIGELKSLWAEREIVAVFFCPRLLRRPWQDVLGGVIKAAPGARPIVCHWSEDRMDWPEAAHAGAFHSLLIPFLDREVHQSLGFVWAADFRGVSAWAGC